MSKNIFVVVSNLKGVNYYTPASEVKVMLAEKELGLSFADEYKKYVINYGAVIGEGYAVTGVCDSEDVNVVAVTKRARNKYPDFPKDMYVIEDEGELGLFILQNRSGEIFGCVPGETVKKIFNTLAEYLEDFYGEKNIN